MDRQNPIYTVKVGDLRFEAVLDSGFLGDFSFSDEQHAHAYYELVLALEGNVWLEPAQQQAICLNAGQACLIPPGIYHCTRSGASGSSKLAVRFHYTQDGGGTFYQPLTDGLENRRETIFLGDQPQLCQTLQQLQRELRSSQVGKELFTQSLLTQSFLLLLRQLWVGTAAITATPEEADCARRLQLEDFLSQNFHAPITEEDLARHMHLSKRQISRIFRQIYGKSFRRLLVEIRLQHAAQLLSETSLSVEEIAQRVGYTSLSGFYDAFRKHNGTTPVQFRTLSEKAPRFR